MPSFLTRVCDYIRRYGASYTLRHAAEKYADRFFRRYEKVWRQIRPDEAELSRQRTTPIAAGLISILVPVYNTDPAMLRELVNAVLAQTYPDWELCLFDDCSPSDATRHALNEAAALDHRIRIARGERNQGISGATNDAVAMARGAWLLLLDHDDLLTPETLYRFAEVIVAQQPDLIYADEDKITEDGRQHTEPHFKPDFCPDNLRSGNYVCHPMMMRRTLFEQAGGLRTAFNGSQDHDLTLRCVELTDRIVHIPRVLYHWRTVGASVSHAQLQKCIDAAAAAVQEHMARIGWPGTVEQQEGMLRLRYDIKGSPIISVILLDDGRGVSACRAALEKSMSVCDNVEWLTADVSARRYAAMNEAAKKATGDVLLFLDASVTVQTPDFMTELLMYAQRDDVAAVTPALWNRRNRITHGGYALGMEGIAVCRERNLPRRAGGWHLLMRQSHNVSAISGACLMIRRDHWIPFNEDYVSGLGMIDWCLRLSAQGLRHVFTPHAGAVCEERSLLLLARKRNAADAARLTETYGSPIADPCHHRMFSRQKANGRLRKDVRNGQPE